MADFLSVAVAFIVIANVIRLAKCSNKHTIGNYGGRNNGYK